MLLRRRNLEEFALFHAVALEGEGRVGRWDVQLWL